MQDSSIGGLPRRTAVVLVLLFAVAFAAYYFLWRNTPAGDGDTPQYLAVAKDLADWRLDALHDRTIGYPLLLAATGAFERATHPLLAVSLLLHLGSVWLLAVVLRATGAGHRTLVLFAAVLLLPLYVEPAAWVLTENLAQFVLVAGFASLFLGVSRGRTRLVLVSGVAFGYAALTRPVYQALAPALAGAMLTVAAARPGPPRWRGASRSAAALLVGSALVLGGMATVNYAKFNYFGLVPSLGYHLCTKTMGFVERLPDEYAKVREIFVRERDAELVKRGSAHTGSQAIWSVRAELSEATGLSRVELSGYLMRMNLVLIRKAPIEYLQEVARSMAVYWFPPATPLASMHSSLLRWLWAGLYVAIVACFFLQLLAVAGLGIVDACRRLAAGATCAPLVAWQAVSAAQRWAYLLAGCIVAYTMLLTCFIDIGDPRQRRPTDVLVVFLCVVGAQVWRRCMGEPAATSTSLEVS